MGLLDGKVAIVTGGGRGIGRAHALALAAEGASVLVDDVGADRDGTGHDPGPASAVAEEIRRMGGSAHACAHTVTSAESARAIVDEAVHVFGGLDILVCAAGVLRDRPFAKMDEASFDAVLAVHVRGTWLCMQAASRVLVAQGRGGRIVLTTGIAGLVGAVGQINTAAASAAVYALTRAGAIELRKHGVTVNAIAPVAKTRLTADLPMFQGVGEESLGPQHVAPVAVFLASDLASEVTGEVVGVAGGRVSRFKMIETAGAFKHDGVWTAQELAARWPEIARGS